MWLPSAFRRWCFVRRRLLIGARLSVACLDKETSPGIGLCPHGRDDLHRIGRCTALQPIHFNVVQACGRQSAGPYAGGRPWLRHQGLCAGHASAVSDPACQKKHSVIDGRTTCHAVSLRPHQLAGPHHRVGTGRLVVIDITATVTRPDRPVREESSEARHVGQRLPRGWLAPFATGVQ